MSATNWTELDQKTPVPLRHHQWEIRPDTPLGDDIQKYFDESSTHLQVMSDETQSKFLEKFSLALCDYFNDW